MKIIQVIYIILFPVLFKCLLTAQTVNEKSVRLLSPVPGQVYSRSGDGIFINWETSNCSGDNGVALYYSTNARDWKPIPSATVLPYNAPYGSGTTGWYKWNPQFPVENIMIGISLVDSVGSYVKTVTLKTEPSNAAVMIDGQLFGNSPVSKKIITGEHRIDVTMDGYMPYNNTVVVSQETNMEIRLNRLKEKINIRTKPSNADFILKDSQSNIIRGKSPYSEYVETGHYTLEIKSPGYQDMLLDIDVSKGFSYSTNIILGQKTGKIYILTDPQTAGVYIENRPGYPGITELGTTPLEKDLKPGDYRIFIRKNGFEEIPDKANIQADKTWDKSYVLKKEYRQLNGTIRPQLKYSALDLTPTIPDIVLEGDATNFSLQANSASINYVNNDVSLFTWHITKQNQLEINGILPDNIKYPVYLEIDCAGVFVNRQYPNPGTGQFFIRPYSSSYIDLTLNNIEIYANNTNGGRRIKPGYELNGQADILRVPIIDDVNGHSEYGFARGRSFSIVIKCFDISETDIGVLKVKIYSQ